jgi:mRNA-degrading endonuclease HigB of HigAB toxin-antitoxin module
VNRNAHNYPKATQRVCGKASWREDGIGALVSGFEEKHFPHLAALRSLFPHADQVGGLTVFNIGGNKARLVAAIHYNRRKVYIRAVLTHAEYDAGNWKEK